MSYTKVDESAGSGQAQVSKSDAGESQITDERQISSAQRRLQNIMAGSSQITHALALQAKMNESSSLQSKKFSRLAMSSPAFSDFNRKLPPFSNSHHASNLGVSSERQVAQYKIVNSTQLKPLGYKPSNEVHLSADNDHHLRNSAAPVVQGAQREPAPPELDELLTLIPDAVENTVVFQRAKKNGKSYTPRFRGYPTKEGDEPGKQDIVLD